MIPIQLFQIVGSKVWQNFGKAIFWLPFGNKFSNKHDSLLLAEHLLSLTFQ